MKKLLLMATGLCITTLTSALTKNDFATAMRALDIATVQQIIANENFSQKEYQRYLNLAEEIVRNREMLLLKVADCADVTTPYEGPSEDQLIAEFLIGSMLAGLSGISLSEKDLFTKNVIIACKFGVAFGVLIIGKFFYDYKKMRKMTRKYIELLRKKYDDAITIKQLIYAANIYTTV